jgi:hypothetical protein
MIKIIARTNAGGMIPGFEYSVTEAIASILIRSGRANLMPTHGEAVAEVVEGTEEVSKLDEAAPAEAPAKTDLSIDVLAEALSDVLSELPAKVKKTKKQKN